MNDECIDSSSDTSSDEHDSFHASSSGEKKISIPSLGSREKQHTRITSSAKHFSVPRTKFYEIEAGQEISVLNDDKIDCDEIRR